MTSTDVQIGYNAELWSRKSILHSFFAYAWSNLLHLLIVPLAVIFFLLILDALGNRVKQRSYPIAASVIVLLSSVGIIIYSATTGSVAVSYLALAFVMTAVVAVLRFVELTALDYAVMFGCFACVIRFVGLDSWLFGSALPTLYVFFVVLSIYKIRIGRLNGQLFSAWFSTILAVAEGYLFDVLFNRYVIRIGWSFRSNFTKLFVWGSATILAIALSVGLIYGIKRLFGERFREINEMGRAYPKIERYFINNSAAIFLLTMLFHLVFRVRDGFDAMPGTAFNLFLLFALAIQLSFLILLFRITWLKDNLQSKTMESQNLADYSSSLEKSMNGMRDIKHDIKNIFVTMGHFVEQSGQAEMRDFFREKISPFIGEEIAKSDLFGKLALIDNEPLKTFMWYKISQAMERGISVDMDIAPRFPESGFTMEFTDLVRILGVLLDNAIEECMSLAQGVITIKLSQNDEMVSYMVQNTVSPERKEAGIKAGVSSKGGDRGRGLVIVRGILEKYDRVSLNSFFRDGCFVQNLVFWRTVPAPAGLLYPVIIHDNMEQKEDPYRVIDNDGKGPLVMTS